TADHLDALLEALLARRLAGPRVAGDVLVHRLTGAERDPVPAGEHLAERRGRLRDDRRVVALPGSVDGADRQGRRGEGGAEPGEGEARVSLARTPRHEVVRAHRRLEPGTLGAPDVREQSAGRDLLVRGVIAVAGHGPFLRATRRRRLPSRCAAPGLASRFRQAGWPRGHHGTA